MKIRLNLAKQKNQKVVLPRSVYSPEVQIKRRNQNEEKKENSSCGTIWNVKEES